MTSLIETSTGPIAYDVREQEPVGGDGDPQTIVMLPSGGHDRQDYDELRELLTPRFRTIALDWPSHGESPAGSLDGSAMSLASVASEAIALLVPGGTIVLGNSVGGYAATRVAIERPDLVRGLVIVDGGGFQPRSPSTRIFCALMSRPGFLRAIYPPFSAAYMRAKTPADARARRTAIATTRNDPGLRAVAELWRSFVSPEHDLRNQARSIAAPTLLIWGRRDPVIPRRFGRRAQRLIAGSRLVVLDTGHVPHTSDPEGVARELIAFTDLIDGAGTPEATADLDVAS
ncbi:MAG TPA: alpha/beta hydrolase [Solirubrobacteraceae bacterium]|jgi:pimeloyl-ACP methyl ester carboxylesterase|nr:alpha/beta hydrolase [Solirubrobacteraceae bacterium]